MLHRTASECSSFLDLKLYTIYLDDGLGAPIPERQLGFSGMYWDSGIRGRVIEPPKEERDVELD